MKNKILLATVYYQPNYGSILQAYATQCLVESLGYEAVTINCNIINQQAKRKKILYYLKKINQKEVFLGQVRRFSLKWKSMVDDSFRVHIGERRNAFETFRKERFYLSKSVSLARLNTLCDEKTRAVLVGSDQLWLPSNIAANFFTLNYVPEHVKKIAYGTSFGVSRLPKEMEDKAAYFLKRLDFISVREKTGLEIVEKVSGREAALVCDPTLLLGAQEWIQRMPQERIIEEKYIFCYFLGANAAHREYAGKLATKKGCKVVNMPHLDEFVKADEKYANESLYDISPLEFLNLIYHAECICTDSFHATIFSIMFHKVFYTFRRFQKTNRASTNNRIDSLLGLSGLEKQIVEDCDLYKEINQNMPDYKRVEMLLGPVREESLQYLCKALE